MHDLLLSLRLLFEALWDVLISLGAVLLPWLPLVAWIAFWLFAVNWMRLRTVLLRDAGLIGVVLLGLMAAFVWAVIAPPLEGAHHLFGLTVSNFVGKFVYVTILICLAWICGAIQLSGMLGDRYLTAEEPAMEVAAHGHDDHGHDGHHAATEHVPAH